MAKIVTVRSVVVVVAVKHWPVFKMDVHNAFLHGDLIEDVSMVLPLVFAYKGG